MSARKEELIKLLNAGLEIRKNLAHARAAQQQVVVTNTAGELSRIGAASLTIAKELHHEHGQALSHELILAARVHLLSNDSAPDAAAELESALTSRVLASARTFGDVALALRGLELLALVHNYTGETWKEVRVAEQAVAIARTPAAVVSLLGAQWRLIEAANISLVTATAEHDLAEGRRRERLAASGDVVGAESDAGAVLESDTQRKLRETLLEHNVKWWHELQWLTALPKSAGFDAEEFLKRFHTPAFAVCVYVGTMLANPFVSEWRSEDVAASTAAFAMAARVADLMHDDEALCVAAAHRVRAFYGRASVSEQQQMLTELRALEQSKRPTATDIRELLHDIEKQQGTFPAATQSSAAQTQQLHQRIVQQLQLFRQQQQRV